MHFPSLLSALVGSAALARGLALPDILTRSQSVKLPRQLAFTSDGGIQIGGAGGLTLGGGNANAAKGNATKSGSGLTLGGNSSKANTTAAANKPASSGQQAALDFALAAGKKNSTGTATGTATGAEGAKNGTAKAEGGGKAAKEAEQFKDSSGITVQNGQTTNVGGDLGITKGSDGSTSVGGESGINISRDLTDMNAEVEERDTQEEEGEGED